VLQNTDELKKLQDELKGKSGDTKEGA